MFMWILFTVFVFLTTSIGDTIRLSTEESDVDKYAEMLNSFELLLEDSKKKDDTIEYLENMIKICSAGKEYGEDGIDSSNSIKASDGQIQELFEYFNLSLQTAQTYMEKQIDKNNKNLLENLTAMIEKVVGSKGEAAPPCRDESFNLALGKPAKQSSTYNSNNGPHAATDGRKEINWIAHSSSCTRNQTNPWWQVDLMKQFPISRVVITNRGDCCGERLHNILVTIGNETNGDMDICGLYIGPSTSGAVETILCEHTVYGQFVKIQIHSNVPSFLTLCEVEIFSR